MTTLVLGKHIGENGKLSYRCMVEVYKILINKGYDVVPFLIRGIDDLEYIFRHISFVNVFMLTYGKWGNNGFLQNVFEAKKIKHNFSNASVSKMFYDRNETKKALKSTKVPFPADIKTYKFPCIVKPKEGENSQGIHFIDNSKDLKAKKYDGCIVEEYIQGQEYTIALYNGLVGNPLKIEKEGYIWGKDKAEDTLDYPEKETVYNMVSKPLTQLYDETGMSDCVRIDFVVKDNQFYVIDVNTMPVLNRDGYVNRSLQDRHPEYDYEYLIEDMLIKLRENG